jgi:type VI secretion system protein ImpM
VSGASITTGFFGKIPATGDFVAAGLPRSFIDRWDRWISMELAARPDGGELDSRVWRFTVPAGIFCDQPCAGAWRMSEDRVGRRYPFAIVAVGTAPAQEDPWFEAAAELALAAVERDMSPATLTSRLATLDAPTSDGKAAAILFWSDDWEVRELVFADIHDLARNGLPAMRAARRETAES